MTEDMPVGLAAAAREIAHPDYKVTALQRAIAEGRLSAVSDPFLPHRRMVTVAAVRAMIAADEATATPSPIVKEEPVKPQVRRPKIRRPKA